MISVRRATPNDTEAIVRTHIATWRGTYMGMVPQAFLDNMDSPENLERRRRNWLQWIDDPSRFFYVAEDDAAGVIGFAVGGKCRNDQPEFAEYDGELYAIYILPSFHGGGIGRKLVQTVAQDLRAAQYKNMLIWALRENQPSRAFYERLGGQFVAEMAFELAGTQQYEIGYGYDLSSSELQLA